MALLVDQHAGVSPWDVVRHVLVAIKEDIDEALLAQIDEMGTTYNLCQRLKLETCKFHDEKIF